MRIFTVLRRFAPMPIVITATVLGAISGLASTWLITVINHVVSGDPIPLATLEREFIVLVAVVAVARFLSSSVLVALGARAANTLQINLARRILAAPLRRLEEVGTHRLLAALVDDVGMVSATMTVMPNTLINTVVVIGCLSYLGWLSRPMLALVLAALALGVATYRIAVVAGSRRQRRARDMEDELFEHLRGVTQGTKELKMRRRRRHDFIALLESVAVAFRGFRVAAQRFFIAAGTAGNFLFFTVIGITLFWAPFAGHLSVEARNGYVLVLLYMIGPLQAVLNTLPDISLAEVAVRKIERLGISLLEESDREAPLPAAGEWQGIELSGVTHTYQREDEEEGTFTLGPLDLKLSPGELVFVIGGNGSGKTTLLKLIIGLYLPQQGSMTWDGEPLSAERLEAYRQLFAVVFSDFYLFEKLFGLDSPSLEAQARRYLGELRLKHKVRVEGGRLSTTELSQGQRKRLALLTAYLEDSSIFVFDEWAADQDPEFKEVFYFQLLPELKARGKTIIVISHDDRYYHVGDRIIKLESGQVLYDKPFAETPYAAELGIAPSSRTGGAALAAASEEGSAR
jgi:putative ATP-binding cassette transporter